MEQGELYKKFSTTPAAAPAATPVAAPAPVLALESATKTKPPTEPKTQQEISAAPVTAASAKSQPEKGTQAKHQTDTKLDPLPTEAKLQDVEANSVPTTVPPPAPTPAAESQSTVEPKKAIKPEPASEPEPAPEPEPEPKKETRSVATPKPEKEPKVEPEQSKSQPMADVALKQLEPPDTEPGPEPEPEPEPKREAEPKSTPAQVDVSDPKALEKALADWLVEHSVDCRQAFNAFDLDGDGTISVDELHKGLSALFAAEIQVSTIEALLSQIDIDSDGSIDYTEFIARFTPNLTESDFYESILHALRGALRRNNVSPSDAFRGEPRQSRKTFCPPWHPSDVLMRMLKFVSQQWTERN